MRKPFFLIVFFLLAFGSGGLASSVTPATLYQNFIRQIETQRPALFSCQITGDVIAKNLARIPPDALEGEPLARTWYRRGVGQVIRVENVDRSFRNLFSAYQTYIGMTGAWLASRGGSWEEFSRQYSLKIVNETPEFWIVKIANLGQEKDSWGEFAFRKSDLVVLRVRFFSRGELAYDVENTYGLISGFVLPTAMRITSWQNGTQSGVNRIEFVDYRFPASIPDSVFSR